MTATKMKYLMTLVEQPDNKRTISNIALLYGVNKSTVSRVINEFIDSGILDKNYKLTIYGEKFINEYKSKYERLVMWLYKNGIDESIARNDAIEILERCSDSTIKLLGQAGEFCKACEMFKEIKERMLINGSDLCDYLSEGEYKVPFVFQKDRKRSPEQVSMANEAFYHPSTMVIKKNASYLCLKLKSMKQKSILNKLELTGKMKSMKYEEYGRNKEVIISEEVAYLPVSAIKFVYIKADNILQGYIRLTLSCTVGNVHMPESTAFLIVYL